MGIPPTDPPMPIPVPIIPPLAPRACGRIVSILMQIVANAMKSCCDLYTWSQAPTAPGQRPVPIVNLGNFNPCCSSLSNCVLNLKGRVICDFWGIHIYFSRISTGGSRGYISPYYKGCGIVLNIRAHTDMWDLAKTFIHELSHCCGTSDPSVPGHGAHQSILGQEVEGCLTAYNMAVASSRGEKWGGLPLPRLRQTYQCEVL
jgi:hypothetical protein